MSLFKITLATAVGLMSAGCGGGGSGTSTPPAVVVAPPTPPVPPAPPTPPSTAVAVGTAGIYDVNYGQFRGVYTLLDNGNFYGIHFVAGAGLAGHPHGLLTKSDSYASPEKISWANFIDDANQVGAQEPAGMFGRTFSTAALNVAIRGSMGSFNATTTQQKTWGSDVKTLYFDALPIATVAGNYTGTMRTAGFAHQQENVTVMAVAGNGAFTVTAAGCNFAGNMTQHGTTGVFDATAQTSGTGCNVIGSFSGVVTPISIAAGNVPTLAFQLNSADNTKTAVFIVTKG